MANYNTVAESNNFIVLERYNPDWQVNEGHQSEDELEREFIQDLQNQGYEFVPNLNTPEKMLANVRVQLEALNKVQFNDSEWQRFVTTFLDKPSDSVIDKTRKVHDDFVHDFTFDDGPPGMGYLDSQIIGGVRGIDD